MNKKTIVVLGIGLLVLVSALIKQLMFNKVFLYAGTIETTKVMISSKLSSDIVEYKVDEGDTVTKGQLLIELSCDTYKVAARQINNDYERAAALVQKDHISKAAYDVAEKNKRDNDLKLQWCQITSPLDGTVITKFRENGEVVAAGETLLSIADTYDVYAYFYVPHNEVYKLKVGQKVIGILPDDNNRRFTGHITKISEEAEFTPKNVQTREERTRLVYGIKVEFDNPDLILKAGMTIESSLSNE